MDKSLTHWKSWGLMQEFRAKFGAMPIGCDALPPAELARLLHLSLLAGEVAAPLTIWAERMYINALPDEVETRTPTASKKLQAYLDSLDEPPPASCNAALPPGEGKA